MFNSAKKTTPTHFLYTIRDAVSETWNTPFHQKNVNEAIRSFSIHVNTPEQGNLLNTHPNDYALYEVGSYDSRTGIIEAYETPKLIAQAASLKDHPATQAA